MDLQHLKSGEVDSPFKEMIRAGIPILATLLLILLWVYFFYGFYFLCYFIRSRRRSVISSSNHVVQDVETPPVVVAAAADPHPPPPNSSSINLPPSASVDFEQNSSFNSSLNNLTPQLSPTRLHSLESLQSLSNLLSETQSDTTGTIHGDVIATNNEIRQTHQETMV